MDGGDNLVCNSAFPTDTTDWGLWEQGQENTNLSLGKHGFYYNNTQNMFVLKAPTGNGVPAATKRFPVKRNTTYSLNVSMFGTGNIKRVTLYYLGRKAGESNTFSKVVTVKEITGSPSTNGLVRYYCTFDTGESDEGFIRIDNGGKSDSAQTSNLYFTELDVYEGTSPRAWQMSPSCLKNLIDSKNDKQTLAITGRTISISNGNSITLPEDRDTVYNDAELKRRVTALETKTDNDKQTLSVSGNNLSISNGNTVQLPVTPAYNDTDVKARISALESKPDNDKQTLALTGRSLSISNGNTVKLPLINKIIKPTYGGPDHNYVNIDLNQQEGTFTVDVNLMKLLADFKSGKLNQYIDDII